MSDYEGEDWDNVDLQATFRAVVPPTEALTAPIAPKGQTLADLKSKYHGQSKRGGPAGHPRLAKTFHPVIQSIHPRTHRSMGGKPVRHNIEVHSRASTVPAYKERYIVSMENPDHIYELSVTWKEFVSKMPSYETSDEEMAQNRLDNICFATGAFIRVSKDTDDQDTNRLHLWGTTEQCQDADKQLRAWEMHVRAPGIKQRPYWHKEKAYDGRQEHRRMQGEMRNYEILSFQQADDSMFDYEAYLIWPDGHDLEAYLKQYDAEILPEIALTFRCRFSHEKKTRPHLTKLQAETESNLLAAYQRLINLVKEMIAQRNKGTHGNLFYVPSQENYRSSIKYEKDPNFTTYTFGLFGNELNQQDSENWSELIKLMEARNRKEIRSSLSSFIETLHVSRSHVRLRVEFGELGLVQFQRTGNDSNTFDTEKFLQMITLPRTELSECLLRAKQKDMFQLVNGISGMQEFSLPQDAYRLMFDFRGSDGAKRLRLETEMTPGFDFDNPEISAQRWLTSKAHLNSENLLGIKVLDLEKPSFMLRVDAFDLFTNEAAIRDMNAFQSTISFRPPRDGLSSFPRRRSIFPPGKGDLISVTEVIIKRFRFKDTDGTFELRREDAYDQHSGKQDPFPTSSRWVASYYYTDWDNLMSDFANIQPGETISWRKDLKTFFPIVVDPDCPRSLPRGFKTFMKEVNEIQGLLGQALSQLPEHKPTIQAGRIM